LEVAVVWELDRLRVELVDKPDRDLGRRVIAAVQRRLGDAGSSGDRLHAPTKHQLSLMIWLCVFRTLTLINLGLDDWLSTLAPVLRTFVLATIAVRS
jgi:hypothetical protein